LQKFICMHTRYTLRQLENEMSMGRYLKSLNWQPQNIGLALLAKNYNGYLSDSTPLSIHADPL